MLRSYKQMLLCVSVPKRFRFDFSIAIHLLSTGHPVTNQKAASWFTVVLKRHQLLSTLITI